MSDFQEKFVDEARELVEGLESKLISLETNPGDNIAVNEIFRVMHTLKGTASMFGFSNIEQVTHNLETIYDRIRDGELSITPEIINLTFESIDLIKLVLDKANVLDAAQQETLGDLVGRINAVSGSASREEKPGEKKQAAMAPAEDRIRLFFIFYSPNEDIYSRGINPISIFYELDELGKYRAVPHLDKTPDPESFNPDKFFVYWDIYLMTRKTLQEVEDVFLFFDETDYFIQELDFERIDEASFLNEYSRITNRTLAEGEVFRIFDSIEGFEENHELKAKLIEEKAASIQKEKALRNIEHQIQGDVKKTSSIRVSTGKLDDLIENVSEFVTLYSQISLLARNSEDKLLNKSIQSLGKLSKKLRDNALDLRLVPINELSLKMHRLVRDLAGKLNKEIHFVTEGMDTELDKTIIDNLEDPLMHIIRNSIDHGIEDRETRLRENKPATGIVRLTAFYSGAYVFIQVQDDGKGINEEVLRTKAIERGLLAADAEPSRRELYDILFEPGFTTAESVSKISGRGVGMDVVKTKISELRGEIEIDSELGLGTSVTLKLPLTLSIIDTLKVKIENLVYLIPLSTVDTCIKVSYQPFVTSTRKQFEYQNGLLPVIILRDEFGLDRDIPREGRMVVIHQYEKKYCLLVDQVLGDHQAVVKPLGDLHRSHDFFSGVSVMGDGSLALILDTGKIMTSNKEMYNQN